MLERPSVCRHPRMIIHYTRSSAPSHIHANAIIASTRGSKMKEKGGSTALSIVNNFFAFFRQSICLSQGFFYYNPWALASWNGMKIEYIKTFFINWESIYEKNSRYHFIKLPKNSIQCFLFFSFLGIETLVTLLNFLSAIWILYFL